MTTRNLGAVSTALTQANALNYSWFVQVDIASPVGTKRFTDRGPANATFSLNIDGGGAQTWTEAGLKVGNLDQSDQDALTVSWLEFIDIDNTWKNWMFTPGLRNATVNVWQGWFNPPAPISDGAFVGAIKMYSGKIDNQEIGDVARLALKPFATPWARQVPWVTGKNLGALALMPRPNVNIQLADIVIRSPSASGPASPPQTGPSPGDWWSAWLLPNNDIHLNDPKDKI